MNISDLVMERLVSLTNNLKFEHLVALLENCNSIDKFFQGKLIPGNSLQPLD